MIAIDCVKITKTSEPELVMFGFNKIVVTRKTLFFGEGSM